jgi:hypothetical protein
MDLRLCYLEGLNIGSDGEPVPVGVDVALEILPLALDLRLLRFDVLRLRAHLGAQPEHRRSFRWKSQITPPQFQRLTWMDIDDHTDGIKNHTT